MTRVLLAAAAAASLLLSCSPPPFDLALSLSQNSPVMSKLTHVGVVGPVELSLDHVGTEAAVLPTWNDTGGIDLSTAFIVYRDPGDNLHVGTLKREKSKGSWLTKFPDRPFGPLPHGRYPVLQPWSLRGAAATRYLEVFLLDEGNPVGNSLEELQANGDATTAISFGPSNFSSLIPPWFGFSGTVVGVSVRPVDASGDRAYALVREDGTDEYLEYSVPLTAGGGLGSPTATRDGAKHDMSSLGMPTWLPRGLYHHYPRTSTSYVSAWDGTQWRCWWWKDIVPTGGVMDIPHPVVAVLSTGELFSVDESGGKARVYTAAPNGTLETAFDLNGMRFIGTVLLDGVKSVLFSQQVAWHGRPLYNIYAIDDSKLGGL